MQIIAQDVQNNYTQLQLATSREAKMSTCEYKEQ